jgi:hypothetical protein
MDLPLLNLSDESGRAQVPARSAIMPLTHFSATPARLIERQLPSYVSTSLKLRNFEKIASTF